MKRYLIIASALCAMVLAACNNGREAKIQQIKDYEQQVSMLMIDENKADTLASLYVAFADKFKKDTLAPEYLSKAAEIMANIGKTDKAIEYIDRVIDNYPDYSDLAGCYFLKGYAYEQGEQFDLAVDAYTYFVETYPDHVLASDTKKILPFIGMDPEKMLDTLLQIQSPAIVDADIIEEI